MPEQTRRLRLATLEAVRGNAVTLARSVAASSAPPRPEESRSAQILRIPTPPPFAPYREMATASEEPGRQPWSRERALAELAAMRELALARVRTIADMVGSGS